MKIVKGDPESAMPGRTMTVPLVNQTERYGAS